MALPRRTTKPMPLKGRYTSAPGDSIGPEYSPDNLNVRFRFGEVRPAPGRDLFDGSPINSPVQVVSQFGMSTNVEWSFMMTATKLYVKDPNTTAGWLEIPGTFVPTGTLRWSWTTGEDHLFFNRGEDTLIQWDGNSANQFDLVKNVAGFEGIGGTAEMAAARFLEYFADRVVLANTVETAAGVCTNRLRWPQRGDFRKWDETLGLGAGFLDIPTERSLPINGMAALGDRLVIYSKKSIIDVVETGQIDPVFIYKVRSRGTGLGASYTIGKANQAHFFLGNDFNVWMWDGVQLRPIGDPIWQELQSLIHLDALDGYFGFFAQKRNEYWLVISDPDRGMFEAFVYDLRTGAWSRDSFPSLTAADEVDAITDALVWNDLIGAWEDQTLTWEQFGGSMLPNVLIGGRSDGATMLIDETFTYDYFAIGSIIDCFLETQDHYLPDENDGIWKNQEILRLILVYNPASGGGDPIEVGISFDQGNSWQTQMKSLDNTGYAFVDFVRTGRVVRYRFRERDNNVQFRYRGYAFQYVVSGDANPGT